MCMVDYGEPATVYKARTVKHTRRLRICNECQRNIEVGEPYHYAFMVYEFDASSWYTCQHCMASQRWLMDQCGGFLHGGVQEDLEEHVTELDFTEPGSKTALLRLIVGMRHHWRMITDPSRLMRVPA